MTLERVVCPRLTIAPMKWRQMIEICIQVLNPNSPHQRIDSLTLLAPTIFEECPMVPDADGKYLPKRYAQLGRNLFALEYFFCRCVAVSLGEAGHIDCRTLKMSHDLCRRAACGMTIWILWFYSESLSVARGVTAMVVGSGALLALFIDELHSEMRIDD